MEFLLSKSHLKQDFIHLDVHLSLLKACSVFLVNGCIINIPILGLSQVHWVKRRLWQSLSKGFLNQAAVAWVWIKTALFYYCVVSVPFKVLSPVPPPLPKHEVQTLTISRTSVTQLPGTPCNPPKVTLCNFEGLPENAFSLLFKNSSVSNFKLGGGYLRASHRGVCDMDNNLE